MELKEEINRKLNMKYTSGQLCMFMKHSFILWDQLQIVMKIYELRGKTEVV